MKNTELLNITKEEFIINVEGAFAPVFDNYGYYYEDAVEELLQIGEKASNGYELAKAFVEAGFETDLYNLAWNLQEDTGLEITLLAMLIASFTGESYVTFNYENELINLDFDINNEVAVLKSERVAEMLGVDEGMFTQRAHVANRKVDKGYVDKKAFDGALLYYDNLQDKGSLLQRYEIKTGLNAVQEKYDEMKREWVRNSLHTQDILKQISEM